MNKSRVRERDRRILRREMFEIEDEIIEEINPNKEIIIKIQIYQSNRLNVPTHSKSFRYRLSKSNVPYDKMEKLKSEGKYACSYLRNIHFYNERFGGLCALCNFELCHFPRTLTNQLDNDCQIYLKNNGDLVEEE